MEFRHYAATMRESAGSSASTLHTKDLDEARMWGARAFCDNRLTKACDRRPLDAKLHIRHVRGVGFGRLTYGSEVTVEADSFDTFYLVQIPLRGRELVSVGDDKVLLSDRSASVINFDRPVRFQHEAETEKLVVRVDRDTLERNCIHHLNQGLRRPLEFQSKMSLDSSGGMRWVSLLRWIYESLTIDEASFDSPTIAAQVEQMVTTMLLTCQPNNYSAELAGDARSIAPAFVKRVERYIEEHADQPITITDLAEFAGVSTRSIFNGFRRFRNTSPMAYLKEVRLRRVNEELKRLTPSETTVTAVAYRWGFTHLGHFTASYKKRFREMPSETLVR